MNQLFFSLLLLFSLTFNNFAQNFWQSMSGPNYAVSISGLLTNASGHLFAATHSAGFFRSTNNGNTWEEINSGTLGPNMEGGRVLGVNYNGDLYAGIDNRGIYKSTNNGNSWSQTPLNQEIIEHFAFTSNGFIFAGSPTGAGVYRSTNNGTSWEPVNNGLPQSFQVSALASSPNGTLFASTNTYNVTLYKSTNYGVKWDSIPLPQFHINKITVNNSGYLFASGSYNGSSGIIRSTNNGNNWTMVNNGLKISFAHKLYCDNNNVFACLDSGLFKSTNNGDDWQCIVSGQRVHSFVKKASGEYFAGFYGKGLFKSSNNGVNWQISNNGITSIYGRYISVSHSGNIYIGTEFSGGFRSTNNGLSWIQIIEPTKSNYSYISSIIETPNGYIFAATDSGLFRSTNNGANWSIVYNTYFFTINALMFKPGNELYIGSDFGVIRSTNYGNNWTSLLQNSGVNAIAYNNSNHLFAGTGGGVYRSTNNGTNWSNAGNLSFEVISLAINSSGYIFAGTKQNGIYRSTNNGDSWTKMLSTNDYILSLAVNSIGNVYAAGFFTGVYCSTNNGSNWILVNSGMYNNMASSIALNSAGYLFAVTYGGRVYRSSGSTIGIKNISSEVPDRFKLYQNYPNPFNPSTKIKFSIPQTKAANPEGDLASIKIYDILGREAAVLVNEKLSPGVYEVEWNASNFPSGIYYYILTGFGFKETRKMIILK